MELIFVRHGLAGERSEWEGPDEERPLTDEGKAQTAQEAAALRRLQLTPDLILTSPLVRARQTAEILARELGMADRVTVTDLLAYGFRRKQLRVILAEHPDLNRLMLVGHEPDLSKVVGRVIGNGKVVLKKGGVAVVNVKDRQLAEGELLCLVAPEVLGAS